MNDLLDVAFVLAPFLFIVLAVITVSDINQRTKYLQARQNAKRK